MKYLRYITLLLMIVLCGQVSAQGKLTGKVIEKSGGAAIEYATIAVLKTTDSSLVAGNVSLEGGTFEVEKIPYGTYIVRITLMGFKPYYHPTEVTFTTGKATVNLGTVKLSPSATVLKAAEVTAERSMMEYQLDKRVINVDKNIVTGGGTATDVLDNVPSVSVDNDGEVSLRGSSNVKVLINGRPYELMGSELDVLLEQIPASSIENVEVITNPSAKYDPEGMSGIINIKLKEQTSGSLGLSGTVNANIGAPLPFQIPNLAGYNTGNAGDPNYTKFIPTAMGTINLTYATEKWNVFFNADGGMRGRGNRSTTHLQRFNNETMTSFDTLLEYNRHNNMMSSAKIGGEYYFTPRTSLLLSYQINGGKRTRMSYIDATDYLYDGRDNYRQTDTNNTNRLNQTAYLLFLHKFGKDQQLSIDLTYTHRHGTGGGDQRQFYDIDSINLDKYYWRETDNKRGGNSLNAKVDYTHPFADRFKLEVGYEGFISRSTLKSYYYMHTFDTLGALNRELDERSSVEEDYNQQIHAIYATFGGKIVGNLTGQIGLRGEYSNIGGKDHMHNNTVVDKNYWQYYPTVHLSYNITDRQSIQLSYSKRVRRPRMQSLDAYINVRQGREMSFGNPNLDPEYTHAIELSYNVGFKQTNIFTSAYFRQTNNKMTMYGFVWDSNTVNQYAYWMIYNPDYDGYWASTWQNLNKGINYGLEVILDQQILKWWKVNLSVNLYGEYIEAPAKFNLKSQNSLRVSGKLSSYMNLPKDWAIQFSGQFRPGFTDLQTTMKSSFWFDLAVKKDVLKRQGTVNLRISDVFCTSGFGHDTHNDQLRRYFRGNRIAPTITLGFTYKINNGLKQEKKQEQRTDDDNYNVE